MSKILLLISLLVLSVGGVTVVASNNEGVVNLSGHIRDGNKILIIQNSSDLFLKANTNPTL